MTRKHATDHEIYRKRGALNIMLGVILFCIVVLIAVGAVIKMSDTNAKMQALREEQNQ